MKIQSEKIPTFFNCNESNILLTRFSKLENILEIIKDRKFHFSPLLEYLDLTEGKTFKQAQNDNSKNSIDPKIRGNVFYASCWFNGDETIYMWDIYGGQKNTKNLAIQFQFDPFKKNILDCGLFRFVSDKNDSFKLNSFKYGTINYVDFNNKLKVKEDYVGRFKSLHFVHENEFRFLAYQNYNDTKLIGLKDLKCRFNDALFDKIKFTVLVSPYASKNYLEFIKAGFKEYKNVDVKLSKFYDLFN